MRYFCVTCKQGHHGNRRHQPITFAFQAMNAIEAMDKAKAMPSVKHDCPIISCREISANEYYRMRQISAYRKVEERPWLNLQE